MGSIGRSGGFLDLGLLARPYDWLRVGLVARNVNSPTFDRNIDLPGQSNEFVLEPQVRMGVAAIPFKNWIIAADIDLQCRSCFDNVRAVLEDAGSCWNALVDAQIFLTHMARAFSIDHRMHA